MSNGPSAPLMSPPAADATSHGVRNSSRAAAEVSRVEPQSTLWRARGQSIARVALPAAGLTALWLLSRPYGGIVHDAQLYVGQALAELDPQGIGRDVMFVQDGQFGFSIFPHLLRFAVAALGPSLAAVGISLLGLLLWLAAMAALANRLAPGRRAWIILIFVCVLGPEYGAFGAFSYGEALAIPRPFAEAGVLAALAMWVSGRTGAGIGLLIAASLFHPIMALPGLAVVLVVLCIEDKRWIGAALAASGVVLVAAGLNLPLAGRLLTVMDPAWHDIVEARSRYLFPSHWPAEAWSRILIQGVTLVIAALLSEGRVRQLMTGVLCVSVAGLAAALIVGDLVPSLLIVQVQIWRSTWLLGVFAAAALALCSVTLWQKGGVFRAVLACLALGWVAATDLNFVVPASTVALVIFLGEPRLRDRIRPVLLRLAWVPVLALASLQAGILFSKLITVIQTKPQDAHLDLAMVQALGIHSLVITILAVIWANTAGRTWKHAWQAVASVALVLAAFMLWDDRSSLQKTIDRGTPDRELTQIIAGRPGDVVWLNPANLSWLQGGFSTWTLAGRPSWVTMMQGAGVVFSHPLALEWDRRVRQLIDLGLAGEQMRAPFTTPAVDRTPDVSHARLTTLCQSPNAPAWVIASMDHVGSTSGRAPVPTWQTPAAAVKLVVERDQITWKRYERYAIFGCSGDP